MSKGIDHTGAPAPAAKAPSMTLGEYLAEAGKALRTSLPKAWVDALVLNAKPTRQGLSLELVEPTADGRQDGYLRGMLWSRTTASIENRVPQFWHDTSASAASLAQMLARLSGANAS